MGGDCLLPSRGDVRGLGRAEDVWSLLIIDRNEVNLRDRYRGRRGEYDSV